MRLTNRRFTLPIILLAVVVLLIFLHYVGILLPLERGISRLLAPIQHRFYSFGAVVNNFYRGDDTSNQSIAQLQAERDRLLIKNAQLNVDLAELSEFSVQGDFLSARGFTAVGARVIGKNFESEAQMILLDRGSNDGIVAGAPVVVRDGAIVGRVIAVEKHQSRMLLLNDSQSSLAAIVQNETNSAGVVVGDRGLTVKMELISNDQIIAVGEVTITSGLEKTIPRGLVIGQIDRVEAEPNSFFQTAFIRPLADLNNLTAVSVVVGFQDE